MRTKVKVLIVDDSRTQQALLRRLIEQDPALEVVGVASDGLQGVQATLALRPDVVLMDVRMPVLDGLEATQRIMAERPTPILLITAPDNYASEVTLGLKAIESGALDLLPKPDPAAEGEGVGERVRARIKLLAGVPVIAHPRPRAGPPGAAPVAGAPARDPATGYYGRAQRLVAIGASTGGPSALKLVLSGLPPDLPAAVAVVQHIDKFFEQGLVEWLDRECRLPVQLAREDDELRPGRVYVAPQRRFFEVTARRKISLLDEPFTPSAHCPSADRLFQSAATGYGRRCVGVVLTGIGSDGARGLLALRQAGGVTIAQDERTSVVYGMPRAAAELGAAARVVPLPEVAAAILEALR